MRQKSTCNEQLEMDPPLLVLVRPPPTTTSTPLVGVGAAAALEVATTVG